MASSRRGAQTVRDAISKGSTPRHVCRSCQQNLLTPNAPSMRHASNLSSTKRVRDQPWNIKLPLRSKASYATQSPQDYIDTATQQPGPPSVATRGKEQVPAVIYQEATNWVGMDRVGLRGHWRHLRKNPLEVYKPFLKTLRRTTVDRDYFLSRLYIAILDVLASKTLGRAPSPDHRAVAESFALSLTADGTIIGLQAREPRAQDPVVRKDLPQQADLQAEHDAGTKVRTSLEQLMTTEVKLNFSDPITFKILEYFTTLTRYRIPDPVLSDVWNNKKPLTAFASLLHQHYMQSKKRSVGEILQTRQEKALVASKHEQVEHAGAAEASPLRQTKGRSLGANVVVSLRRQTPIDKHKEVGRWKVVERELMARGLPSPVRTAREP